MADDKDEPGRPIVRATAGDEAEPHLSRTSEPAFSDEDVRRLRLEDQR